MGTTALCSSKMPCDILAFTRRVCVLPFRCPLWLGWQHIARFRPIQSVVRFLRCLGQTVIPLFSSSGTSNLPALLRIKSASEIFEPVAPRLLPTPRLTRCDSISRVHDSKGQILKPTPSAPQGESTDQKEHFSSMRNPTYFRRMNLLFFQLSVYYVTNIPEVRFQATLAVQVLHVLADVFILINIYQQQTDFKT